MKKYRLETYLDVIEITAFRPNGPVRNRGKCRPHDGPTFELTVIRPRDPPESFCIPFPITNQQLRKRVASYGVLLFDEKPRELKALIEEAAQYVWKNHGWSKDFEF